MLNTILDRYDFQKTGSTTLCSKSNLIMEIRKKDIPDRLSHMTYEKYFSHKPMRNQPSWNCLKFLTCNYSSAVILNIRAMFEGLTMVSVVFDLPQNLY